VAIADAVDNHAGARVAVGFTAVEHGRIGDAVGADQRLEHRHVDVRALLRALAPEQRTDDRPHRMRRGQHVGRLQVRRTRFRVALLQVHHPGDRVGGVRERRALAPGPGLPVAGDRAIDDVGLDPPHGLVVAAELADHAGREVLDEHVGLSRQIHQHCDAVRARQVDADALLAGVGAREIRALVEPSGLDLVGRVAGVVARARTLDLDHACTHVGEQPCAVRAGQHTREVEHDDALQGERDVACGVPGRCGHVDVSDA
jgi:hypothetical protein